MSFFQRSKTRTPRLPNENKIIDLTSTYSYQDNDLVCEDCGIYLLHDPKHPQSSETKHIFVCPKCSQVTSTEDPIIKRKGRLDIVTEEEETAIEIVDDTPPELKMFRPKRTETRSTEIL